MSLGVAILVGGFVLLAILLVVLGAPVATDDTDQDDTDRVAW